MEKEYKCPYCGKEYKSEYYYKEHIKDCKEKSLKSEVKVERPKKSKKATIKNNKSEVQYREVVYVGTADKSTIKGKVTGKKYKFHKDKYEMPIPVEVDNRDYPSLVALKGKGCFRKKPKSLYILKSEWDLKSISAKKVNS